MKVHFLYLIVYFCYDEDKECFDSREDPKASLEGGDYHICSVAKDMDYRMRTDGVSSMFTDVTSSLDYAVTSSLAAERSLGTEAVENGKRSSNYFCDDAVNKRARQDNEAGKLEQLHENSFASIPPEGKLPGRPQKEPNPCIAIVK